MFKKSIPVQKDLFKDISNHVSARKSKLLSDPKSWHNVFYREVFNRIEEEVFTALYCKDNGRPNATLRILLSMMILKEGNGWSDEQLFDECRFNLKVMASLGLCHMDDDPPTESTYYDFRKKLTQHHEDKGVDLIKESFQKITSQQITYHDVNGEKIRLDSKLIQSNIAKCTRLELILEAVRVFIKPLDLERLTKLISEEDLELLEKLKQNQTTHITFPLNKSEKNDLLIRLGSIIEHILNEYHGDLSHNLLKQVFVEHYQINSSDNSSDDDTDRRHGPELKPNKEVPSSSIQSVHDPEASFRSKGQGYSKQNIAGYHANITETCSEENGVNLIVDVQLDTANVSENEFLEPSITDSEKILQQSSPQPEQKIIKHVTCDGGYDSKKNREIMGSDNMPHWNMHNHKGAKQRYILTIGKHGELQVYCTKNNEQCEVTYSQKANKYVITHSDKTRRYLTKEQVEDYFLVQQIKSKLRPEDENLRPNVESTIHQVFHRLLKRNKVKYRGKYKCNMYVISRVFWANFKRISKNGLKLPGQVVNLAIEMSLSLHFMTFAQLTMLKMKSLITSKNQNHSLILIPIGL
ncbi:MAG: transposase [Crocinitomicaceae bacterium]|nr:transposase [Crocinitomicaceae bacterium]